jgi:hypothetical protein
MATSVGLIIGVLAVIPIGTLLFMGLARACSPHSLQQSATSLTRSFCEEAASSSPFVGDSLPPLVNGGVCYISLVIKEKPVSSSGTS